ncbi:MAG: hypothetical protein U0638_10470 [Phycisphaerales bacterium]
MIVGAIIILLAWMCAFVASIAAAVNALHRWGREQGLPGLLCPLGVLMTADCCIHQLTTYGTASAQGQPSQLRALLVSLAIAVLGVGLAVFGWLKTNPREFPAGCCQKCGYELNDLPRCPECGTDRPPTNGGESDQTSKATTNSPGPTPLDSLAGKGDQTL